MIVYTYILIINKFIHFRLLLNWNLSMKPKLKNQVTNLDICNNTVRVDVDLSTMTVKADYLLFKNRSLNKYISQLELLSPLYSEDIHGEIE